MRRAAVVLAVVAAFGFTGCSDDPKTGLDRAQALVGDAGNFDTGREAGQTMVSAADELLAEAQRCIDSKGETNYCLAFRAAAAWSNVAAVQVLDCRAPGRFSLQQDVTKFYAALADLKPGRDMPRNPPLPDCE